MMDHKRFRVKPETKISLSDFDPAFTGGFAGKNAAQKKLDADIQKLISLEAVLGSQARYGMLIVFQGMDTAGKDGAIKHVMSGLNPQGVSVYSFKQPSLEEVHHDFMWRSMKVVPPRGRIGIFNRSYYEDVLVTRVHPELLTDIKPDTHDGFWHKRFEDIVAYERYLVRNGIVVLKFFLHISKDEQKKRLLERLDDPHKQWKFSLSDVQQRPFWDAYMTAYEKMLGATSSKASPWYVIPSDHKWFARVAVADILVRELESLDLRYPKLSAEQRAQLSRLKKQLS